MTYNDLLVQVLCQEVKVPCPANSAVQLEDAAPDSPRPCSAEFTPS